MKMVEQEDYKGLFFPDPGYSEDDIKRIEAELLAANKDNGEVEDLDLLLEIFVGVVRKDAQCAPEKGTVPRSSYFDGEKVDLQKLHALMVSENPNICEGCGYQTVERSAIPKDGNYKNPHRENWYMVCKICRSTHELDRVLSLQQKAQKQNTKSAPLAALAYIPELSQASLNLLMRCAYGMLHVKDKRITALVRDVMSMMYDRCRTLTDAWGTNSPMEFAKALHACELDAYDMRSLTMHGVRVIFHPRLFAEDIPQFYKEHNRIPFEEWDEKIFIPANKVITQISLREGM